MDEDSLKEQFHILQAQQQQKLLERRKKREGVSKDVDRKSKNNETFFGTNDALSLKTFPANNGSYISEDNPSDQIRQLKDENGRLYKLSLEKDFEVRQLRKKMEENRNISVDGALTNEIAATKIIELSKKIRELTSEKEAEKTRCKQLQKQLHDLQMQSLLPPASTSASLQSNVEKNKDDDVIDVKLLQERLKQSEARATDFRNQCLSLRQELKVAHKVLSQEIGEDVNFQMLLNESSNWRGRAQQIIALQGKVDELRVQLDGSNADGEKNSSAKRRQEEKHRDELRKMERDRKEAQEHAAVKLKNLEVENQSLLDKVDAGKARNKVLSNEIKTLKLQMQTLLKKSRNDDEFIDALMKQQSQMKQLLEDHNKQQTQHQYLQQQQLHQMTVNSQHNNNIVEQLKAVTAQKEAQVNMLELELNHLKMVHMNIQQPHGATTPQQSVSSPDFDAVTSNRTIPLTAATDVTPRSIPLTTATDVTSRRPVTDEAGEQEATFMRLQNTEMQVMNLAVEVEKDKMTELVQVLQERLSEETLRHAKAEADLQAQRRQTVELEKRLARTNLVAHGGRDMSLTSVPDVGVDSHSELQTRLDIQRDEIDSLKAALERTLKAKNEDMKVYSTTLEETKRVFLQALRQLKGGQSVSR
ncbi:hypothetical protein BsWGS_09261 [Bradybaena similaris]